MATLKIIFPFLLLSGIMACCYGATYYSLSSSRSTWQSGNRLCRHWHGRQASLVNIETESKFKSVINVVRDLESGPKHFWSNGGYDMASTSFIWGKDNTTVGSWAPWDEGYPTAMPSQTRIAVFNEAGHPDQKFFKFRNYLGQQIRLHFMCEWEE